MRSPDIRQLHIKTWAISIVAVITLVAIALLRGRGPVTVDSGQMVVMGTFSRTVVVTKNRTMAIACIKAVIQDQQEIEAMMSFHRPDSQLSRINAQAYYQPVPVPGLLFDLIQKAIDIARLSHGAFDPTIGPLVALWRKAGQQGLLPSDDKIRQALEKVGYSKLIVDPNTSTIRFAVEGMMLDLGGIAKGYAVDRSIEILKHIGALGGMVDIGGNIRCFGRPPDGATCWSIGVQDPTKVSTTGQDGITMVLNLTDQAVATSGHYYRFEVIEGRTFSHIIDPRTGQTAETLTSVTVIAPDATTADGLSTAVAVLGPDEGLRLLNDLPGVDGILMRLDPSGRWPILMTDGVKDLLADSSLDTRR